jgi:hypothetical protein
MDLVCHQFVLGFVFVAFSLTKISLALNPILSFSEQGMIRNMRGDFMQKYASPYLLQDHLFPTFSFVSSASHVVSF